MHFGPVKHTTPRGITWSIWNSGWSPLYIRLCVCVWLCARACTRACAVCMVHHERRRRMVSTPDSYSAGFRDFPLSLQTSTEIILVKAHIWDRAGNMWYRLLSPVDCSTLWENIGAASWHAEHFPVAFSDILLVYCSSSGHVLFFAAVKTFKKTLSLLLLRI